MVCVAFLLYRQPAFLGHAGHEGEDRSVVGRVGLQIFSENLAYGAPAQAPAVQGEMRPLLQKEIARDRTGFEPAGLSEKAEPVWARLGSKSLVEAVGLEPTSEERVPVTST